MNKLAITECDDVKAFVI